LTRTCQFWCCLVVSAFIQDVRSRYLCFINDSAPSEIYTLSLHDALPILTGQYAAVDERLTGAENLHMMGRLFGLSRRDTAARARSEEHTSELQSRENLVCRLLLEKKKKNERNS